MARRELEDIVAVWDVPLGDGVARCINMPHTNDNSTSSGVHRVEFEHGTTTGKRVVRVDGREVIRHDWLFKLVGRELFTVGRTANAAINIEVSTVEYWKHLNTSLIGGRLIRLRVHARGERQTIPEVH